MPKPTTQTGLLAKLQSHQLSDTRPPGWKTLEELIKDDPMAKTTARVILKQAIADGLVETKKLKSPAGNGRFALRINYKEKS